MSDNNKEDPHKKWAAIVPLFLDSGLAETKPLLKHYCEIYLTTLDYSNLEDLISKHPELIAQATAFALKNQRQAIPFAPPTREDAPALHGDIKVAVINNNLDYLCLKPKHFTEKVLFFGEPGSGKTHTMSNIITQILNMPERNFNVIIFQFIKQDYNWLLKYYPNIYLLNQHNTKWNPFHKPETIDVKKEDWVTAMIETICSINYFGAVSMPLISDAAFSLLEQKKEVNFSSIWNFIINNKDSKGSKSNDAYFIIKNRLKNFIRCTALNSNPIFPISFWQNNDIILDFKSMYSFAASTFPVCLMQALTMCNEAEGKRNNLETLFICDESYMIFKKVESYLEKSTLEPLENLLRTMREPGIGILAGTQNKESINPVLIQNSAHFLTFRTPPEYKEETQKLLGLNNDQAEYLIRLPERAIGIARLAHYPEPLLFIVPSKI